MLQLDPAVLAPAPSRAWRAHLTLGFERRGDKTVLATRRHDGPLIVQKPLYQEGPEVCQAIVVHPPAGIAGGDTLHLRIEAGEQAHAQITTPGAAKWYRSIGPWAEQRVHLRVQANARLEWLPQETIVYRGALARNQIDIELEADAGYIGWDILCLGRTGSGERFSSGTWRSRTRLTIDHRLVWIEQIRITGDDLALQSNVGLAGHSVVGTMLVVGSGIDAEQLAAVRSISASPGQFGATRLPALTVARYRGDSSEAARHYFQRLWELLRPSVLGRAASAPRIWRT